MEVRLSKTFPGCQVAVVDLTGTQDHFEVRIHHPELLKLPRIRRHQSVMQIFDSEVKSGEVHALSIRILEE